MIGHCYWNSILPWFSKLSVTVPVRRGVWRTASWTRTAAEMGSQPVGAKNWVSQPEDDIWLVVWNHGILFSPIVGMMIQSDELHHFSGGLKDLYDIWLVVWNHGILWLSIQLGMSQSQLTFTPSFFRGVGQPPSRYIHQVPGAPPNGHSLVTTCHNGAYLAVYFKAPCVLPIAYLAHASPLIV